jgi:hypothetical protein
MTLFHIKDKKVKIPYLFVEVDFYEDEYFAAEHYDNAWWFSFPYFSIELILIKPKLSWLKPDLIKVPGDKYFRWSFVRFSFLNFGIEMQMEIK